MKNLKGIFGEAINDNLAKQLALSEDDITQESSSFGCPCKRKRKNKCCGKRKRRKCNACCKRGRKIIYYTQAVADLGTYFVRRRKRGVTLFVVGQIQITNGSDPKYADGLIVANFSDFIMKFTGLGIDGDNGMELGIVLGNKDIADRTCNYTVDGTFKDINGVKQNASVTNLTKATTIQASNIENFTITGIVFDGTTRILGDPTTAPVIAANIVNCTYTLKDVTILNTTSAVVATPKIDCTGLALINSFGTLDGVTVGVVTTANAAAVGIKSTELDPSSTTAETLVRWKNQKVQGVIGESAIGVMLEAVPGTTIAATFGSQTINTVAATAVDQPAVGFFCSGVDQPRYNATTVVISVTNSFTQGRKNPTLATGFVNENASGMPLVMLVGVVATPV
ncbi:MAG: hypothetical protein Hyperionvirus2_83 [Hyperionvirus sp.]|uniref:Uncharacterized protein n=1 Tax=Hyperionvirus sp. TaxID=2487770 RepID=A0A3G5A638_9VIRU|nr:MAG: hypothetical protein Hyperionvirus2_83 [Hyperionvirus sp.]